MTTSSSQHDRLSPAPDSPRRPNFGRRLVSWRHGLLAIGAALGLGLTWGLPQPQYDRSIENMFAADDPVRLAYERLTRRFSANEIILAVYTDPNLFADDGAGLRRLSAIAQRLRESPGVRDVLSLAELNAALDKIDLARLFVSDATPPLLRDRPLARELLELFAGMTHGEDRQTAAIACLLEPRGEAAAPRRDTVESLRAVMRSLPPEIGAPGMITGEPVMVADGFRFVEQDGRRLAYVSTLLIAACIALVFRSLRWLAIPLLVVQLALALSNASLALMQSKITLVSSMTAAVLTVIGVAAVVHIIVGVRRGQAAGLSPQAAMEQAMSRLAAPIFWSAVTDAVGFASLTISAVGPVRDYGWIMAIGSLFVLPAVFLLTPGLALIGPWDRRPHRAWGEAKLDDSLAWSSRQIERHPRGLAISIVVAVLICIAGISRLQLETDFTRSFRQDNPLVQSYAFVEERLGGAGVWDIMLPAPRLLDEPYLQRVRNLESDLRSLQIGAAENAAKNATQRPGFTKVISLVDAIDVAGVSPALRWAPAEAKLQAMAATMPAFFGTLRTVEESPRGGDGTPQRQAWIRVMLRSHERQEAAQKQQLIAATRELLEKHFPAKDSEPRAEAAGFFVLLSELVQSTVRDQWRCFLLSAAGMMVALTIALRSMVLAVLALVTNAAPVLAVLGMTGWLGIRVNLGVAMIATVSLGLSVDSSLHFLFDYRRRRQDGVSRGEALSAVQQGVGRAMLFATGSLVAGFLVLTTSPFVPTATFGWLAALAMIGGVAGNLVVLPMLIHWLPDTFSAPPASDAADTSSLPS
ncbi:MAG: MMPL family transporter [Planctomycetales bacterium]|nr:MMPL family transporter [Planctomycetales bacterium]